MEPALVFTIAFVAMALLIGYQRGRLKAVLIVVASIIGLFALLVFLFYCMWMCGDNPRMHRFEMQESKTIIFRNAMPGDNLMLIIDMQYNKLDSATFASQNLGSGIDTLIIPPGSAIRKDMETSPDSYLSKFMNINFFAKDKSVKGQINISDFTQRAWLKDTLINNQTEYVWELAIDSLLISALNKVHTDTIAAQ